MLDVENYIYTQVTNALPTVDSSSVFIPNPEKSPHLYFTELNRTTHTPYISTDRIDNAEEITFEAQVTSAKKDKAKSECKTIMDSVDNVMYGMRFQLIYSQYIPEVDRTKYRLVHRYRGVVRGYINGATKKFSVVPR